MTLLLDAGALYAQANRDDPMHHAVVEVVDDETGALVTCEAAAQEADYLIGARLGVDVELAYLDDLASGAIEVACLDLEERRATATLARRHRDLAVGMADAGLVVLAGRYGTRRLLTVDQRHFRVLSPPQGGSFTVLPFDR